MSPPYAERAVLHVLCSHRKAAAVAVKSELNIQMRDGPLLPTVPTNPERGPGRTSVKEALMTL